MLRVYKLAHVLGQWLEDAGWMLSCWGRLGMMKHVLTSVNPQDSVAEEVEYIGVGC